jgi:hypothetical protein
VSRSWRRGCGVPRPRRHEAAAQRIRKRLKTVGSAPSRSLRDSSAAVVNDVRSRSSPGIRKQLSRSHLQHPTPWPRRFPRSKARAARSVRTASVGRYSPCSGPSRRPWKSARHWPSSLDGVCDVGEHRRSCPIAAARAAIEACAHHPNCRRRCTTGRKEVKTLWYQLRL